MRTTISSPRSLRLISLCRRQVSTFHHRPQRSSARSLQVASRASSSIRMTRYLKPTICNTADWSRNPHHSLSSHSEWESLECDVAKYFDCSLSPLSYPPHREIPRCPL